MWQSAADSHLKQLDRVVVVVVVVILPRLSGRAGPLPIKGNKLLGSLGYRSNPQGALL